MIFVPFVDDLLEGFPTNSAAGEVVVHSPEHEQIRKVLPSGTQLSPKVRHEADPYGAPQHQAGVMILGVPKTLAKRWAKANSRPLGFAQPEEQ